MLDPTWGPFTGGPDAQARLTAFVDKACGHGVGIVWAANGALYPFRAPRRDGDGIGEVAIFQWSAAPPPPPRAPHGFREHFIAFWNRYAQLQYESARAQAEGNIALARAVGTGINRMIHTHTDDGIGVAFDVVCVVLTLALLPTGLSELAWVGLAGGAVLLYADGRAYGEEICGDEEAAERTKKRYEVIRLVATVATLPDVAYGGFKVVRELQEVREMRALDRATASSAQGLAARTASAARAQRFAQIAERANLRAQIRSEQIAAVIRLELVPRAAGVGATGLLIREEIREDKSALAEVMRRLQCHCTGDRR